MLFVTNKVTPRESETTGKADGGLILQRNGNLELNSEAGGVVWAADILLGHSNGTELIVQVKTIDSPSFCTSSQSKTISPSAKLL